MSLADKTGMGFIGLAIGAALIINVSASNAAEINKPQAGVAETVSEKRNQIGDIKLDVRRVGLEGLVITNANEGAVREYNVAMDHFNRFEYKEAEAAFEKASAISSAPDLKGLKADFDYMGLVSMALREGYSKKFADLIWDKMKDKDSARQKHLYVLYHFLLVMS